jgi:serine/threonine-protein kinase
MSPEQAQGQEAGTRSDVFSLGAVAYRALTGRPAFSGLDTPRILFEIVFHNPVRPTQVAPTLPRDVDHVLAIALAKEPQDRFRSAPELSAALRAACASALEEKLRHAGGRLERSSPWRGIASEENADEPTREVPGSARKLKSGQAV